MQGNLTEEESDKMKKKFILLCTGFSLVTTLIISIVLVDCMQSIVLDAISSHETGWSSGQANEVVVAVKISIIRILLIAGAVVAFVSFLLSAYVTRWLFLPFHEVRKILEQINKGSLNKSIRKLKDSDLNEIGGLINNILSNIKRMMGDIILIAEKTDIYSGKVTRNGEIANRTSQEIATAVSEVSQGIAYQSEHIEKTSNNTFSMLQNAEKISELAKNSIDISQDMQSVINSNNDILGEVINRMKANAEKDIQLFQKIERLKKEASEIDNITTTVTYMSEQTNLLALNAAIEAARAGEAGRGFTVVSEEVRKLAQQSAHSAEEIKSLVEKIIAEIQVIAGEIGNKASGASENIGFANDAKDSFAKTILSTEKVVEAIKGINDLVDEEKEMAMEINTSMKEISAIVQQSAANSQQTAASTQEQSSFIHEVVNAMKQLNKMTQEVFNIANNYVKSIVFDDRTKEIINESMAVLREISNDERLYSMDWDRTSPILQQYVNKYKQFNILSIMDEKGVFRGCNFMDYNTTVDNLDFSHREYYKESIRGKEYVSDPLISIPSYKYGVPISCPIRNKGEIIGVIMGEISIEI